MLPRLRAKSKNAERILLLLAVLMNHSDSAARRGNFSSGKSELKPPRERPRGALNPEGMKREKNPLGFFNCGGIYHIGGMGASAPIF